MGNSLRWPGIAGARLREGTLPFHHYHTLGDSLLMDFSHNFFAVSDSSPKSPAASGSFLFKFSQVLDEFSSFDPGTTYRLDFLTKLKRGLTRKAEALLTSIPYGENCTFTGILIIRTGSGTKGILFHTGDSLLFQVAHKIKKIEELTKKNFLLVGRTSHFFQVEEIDILPEALLIITTDGFCDLEYQNYRERNNLIIGLARSHAVEELPDKILENIDSPKNIVDDIGIISLCPERMTLSKEKIVLTGSSSYPAKQGKIKL